MKRLLYFFLFLKKHYISIILVIFGGLLSSFGGSISKSSYLESIGFYASSTVQNHTVNGRRASIIVDVKDGSREQTPSPHAEYISTYGLFGLGTPLYSGVVNGDKKHLVHAPIIGDDNYSFVIADYNSNNKYGDHYRHEFYNLDLMFSGIHRFDGVYSFCYLSESQANVLLDLKGKEHNKENYRELLSDNVEIFIDGESFLFSIGNIYLEEGFYYSALHDVIGSFFMTYVKIPTTVKKQALYFMGKYEYQNEYMINYICSRYNSNDYYVRLNDANLINTETINFDLINSYFINQFAEWKGTVSTVLLVFSFFPFLALIGLMHFNKVDVSSHYIIMVSSLTFLYLLISRLLSLLFTSTFLCSRITSIVLFVHFFLITLLSVIIKFVQKKKKLGVEKTSWHEIEI